MRDLSQPGGRGPDSEYDSLVGGSDTLLTQVVLMRMCSRLKPGAIPVRGRGVFSHEALGLRRDVQLKSCPVWLLQHRPARGEQERRCARTEESWAALLPAPLSSEQHVGMSHAQSMGCKCNA